MNSGILLDFRAARGEEADARIKGFLVESIGAFFRQYPAEKVSCHVLTGAMTRGEGSCESTEQGTLVYSDYDLLVVLKDRKDFPEAQVVFPRMARAVSDTLREKGLCSHVDFAPITRDHFLSMKPSMFSLEVAEHGKVVWGDGDVLRDMERPDPARIPVEDALILVFNRTASHLSMADSLRFENDAEFPFAFYHNGKIFLDIVSCILVLERKYRPTYRGRLDEISRLVNWRISRLPGILEDASFWTEYKLNPRTDTVLRRYSSFARSPDRRGVGIFLWSQLVPRMAEVLRMCVAETCGAPDRPLQSGLAAYLRMKSLLQRLREYRSFVERFGRSLETGRLRGPWSAREGAPLDRAYAALALLLLAVKGLSLDAIEVEDALLLQRAGSFLPVHITGRDGPLGQWREIRDAATEVWRLVVKGGGY